MKKQKAFTLVELLVVISIIALLMGILIPALRIAKEQAKRTVCCAHMKGLGLALKMYVDDNDGKTHDSPNNGLWDNAWSKPVEVVEYEPDDSYAYWGIAYAKYADNKKIFSCPSAIRVDDWPEWGWGEPYQNYFKYCSYGLNGYITNKKIDEEFKHHYKVIAFQDHIEQRLDSIDSDMFCIGPNVRINLTQWRSQPRATWFPNGIQECFRHLDSSNTCWLDGHVSAIEETTGEDVPCSWYTGKRQRNP